MVYIKILYIIDRTIVSNVPDMAVPDNKITTSKYSSIITFIPLNLIE